MKKFLKYIIIFGITLLTLFLLLVVTAKIPRSAIQENIKKSTSAFKTKFEIYQLVKRRDYTFTHPYADAMLLNIIYCIDTDDALSSVMEAKYYSKYGKRNIEYNFEGMVNEEVTGNTEYLRYWHGQMSILRPLLVFFDLGQIYIINNIAFWALTILLIIILIKKKHIKLLISFLVGFIMCAVPIVPLCLEYSVTFYIMIISTIIAIYIEKKEEKLNVLFFITGIITNYFDFLTTEIITIFVPIIFILAIRYKEKRLKTVKEAVSFIIKSTILWFAGYALMWISKWILAGIILDINVVDFVKDHIAERLHGEILYMDMRKLPYKAIIKNLSTLYPLNIQKNLKKLIIIPIAIVVFEIIFIKKKNIKKELWFPFVLLMLSVVPYIRYIVLANHSYKHYFFTFRSQIISIMCLMLAIIYSVDPNILKKEIKIKIKGKKNGTNNINS